MLLCTLTAVRAGAVRVVSINLCSDQYLIELAAREDIASVTALAADPLRSAEAEGARGLAINRGAAEEVIAAHPDLVLANAYSDPNLIGLLRRLGLVLLILPDVHGFAGIEDNVRLVARALGAETRAETVIARMEEKLRPPTGPAVGRPVVAVLEPGGYGQGAGTLIDEAIARAGGLGLDARLGVKGYAPLPIERLVASQVDLLVTPNPSAGAPSLGFALLDQPALRRRFSDTPKLSAPGNLTDCPAPASAELVPILRRALAAAGDADRQ